MFLKCSLIRLWAIQTYGRPSQSVNCDWPDCPEKKIPSAYPDYIYTLSSMTSFNVILLHH